MRPSLLAIALVAAALLLPTTSASAQASATCPSTFHVLHDDAIGALELPAGHYAVIVRGGLSCSEASDLFRTFLEDFDGKLPRPWTLDATTASFTRGTGSLGFSVVRVAMPNGGGGGGRHPASGTRCPGTFRVLHNDRIGKLKLPHGPYRITIVGGVGTRACQSASSWFTRFLDDFDGMLSRPWKLNVQTATFTRGVSNVGFRVKPLRG